LVEDGSVTAEDWDQLQGAFPNAVFHPKHEVRGRIEQFLEKHSACLDFYRHNVLAPKLFEAPLLSASDLHFCDSDLLFFRKIEELWPASSSALFLFERHQTFSSFSHNVYHWAVRYRIPLAENINAGFIRFPRALYDLDKIEWFLRRAHNPRNAFLIEQTCWSFLVADVQHKLIDPRDILCTKDKLPTRCLPPAIHFIGEQKNVFWNYVPDTDKYIEADPVTVMRTISGRRISLGKIGAHIAKGFNRRLKLAITSKFTSA
jgi:hypothetical protein